MKITDVKTQKSNTDRFSVYIDGVYAFSLPSNELLEAQIRVGSELSESEIDKFKQLSSDSLLLVRTYEKCLRRPHSEKEIRDYLWTKKADPALVDSIIEKCYSKKLLDDEQFAERWAVHRRKSGKSNRYIQNELRSKGVAQEIVAKVLESSDGDQLQHQIEKKKRKYPDEKKLIAYLQRQGFSYGDIESALRNEAD